MEFGFTTAAYVVAAVLFILSLGGLSGQESAKRAVWYGIIGMALAVNQARNVLLRRTVRRAIDGVSGVLLIAFGLRLARET